MNINILSTVTELQKNQQGFHLINDMCDLTQFIIFSITTDTKEESPAKFFMKNPFYHLAW